ncbi:hypothetical protein EG68_01038 [Paragonimus skrjabini miyazakii]|uniref:Uncharacterized protein n=1 Tax=Paragonimus skrjabini miyazakii TaxID=59628 RepID=A0A8S9ZBJ6_9TREM|nr:hypothetical protein EG68_01038 [Paragonimus skrjabini miyazakii]
MPDVPDETVCFLFVCAELAPDVPAVPDNSTVWSTFVPKETFPWIYVILTSFFSFYDNNCPTACTPRSALVMSMSSTTLEKC